MSDLLQIVGERVQFNMDRILTNFKGDVKITVLVRTPGKDTADFCMTNDDLAEVEKMVRRRRDAVSHATPGITIEERKAQGARCNCGGSDDYCPCQNVPDPETMRLRSETDQ